MTKLHQLADLGQAIWLDYIRRSFITSGDLQALIDEGLRGMTSNPTIFEKAIAGSADYDQDLRRLVDEGRSVEEIYEALALDDIRRAADLLRPVYDGSTWLTTGQTGGADGYVSLEVSPNLAYDTEGTIAEARRLFATLNRPNVMIKVPATPAGIPAIETLIGEGVNVNVTLMFSLAHYEAVAEAYIAGLEKLAGGGGDPSTGSGQRPEPCPERSRRAVEGRGVSQVASVASFFVSRVDTAVDLALEAIGTPEAMALQGKIAIANAKVTYARFREIFSGKRWERLAAQGARVQRPLWASTSTKNPLYPDTLYVESLIGSDTVNTVPPTTLYAFRDHGTVAPTLEAGPSAELVLSEACPEPRRRVEGLRAGLEEARAQLAQLAELGVDLDAITQKLQDDGVAAFAKSFEALMAAIAEKREQLLAGWQHRSARLGTYQATVDAALAEIAENRVLNRIWAHDYTVWKPEPTEITNRLGWLHTAEVMSENLYRLEALAEAVRADGYTHALLLGMGGSSLAPEVLHKTLCHCEERSDEAISLGVKEGYLDLAVLDSTDPGAVLAHAERLDGSTKLEVLDRTLFIVATKSGTTVETLSFFKFFYNQVADAVGADRTGEHFVAITDPGTPLTNLAERYSFRTTFLNDPNIGGRYSALSYFGLVPVALVGVDVPRLLDRGLAMASGCESCVAAGDNSGAWLGAILGELAKAGRDKVTFAISPAIASFGDWVEQLIAESTGKEGTGILPVVGEPLGLPEVYSDDRLFIHLRLSGDDTHDAALDALEAAGHPVVRLNLHDRYDLGGQFFLWEMATAVASHLLGINPFDQPNVEAAKVLARRMVAEYTEKGTLPSGESAPLTAEALNEFLAQVQPGDPSTALRPFDRAQGRLCSGQGSRRSYIALQAYLQPTAETDAALAALRARLRDRFRLATTVGYGPRFLHSTGQLHKGDAGNGLFIQFTADDPRDAPIPDEAGSPGSSITFGVLKAAQALGDRQALLDAGRRVIRFHLGVDAVGELTRLSEALS